MRTSFFPFTEPSVEFDITCYLCDGQGCPVCKHSGWIEMGGAGVVDPNVFEAVGYDPEEWSGLRVRARDRPDRVPPPRPPRPAALLGQRPAHDEAVLMKVPVSWLREYVDFDWPVEQLAREARLHELRGRPRRPPRRRGRRRQPRPLPRRPRRRGRQAPERRPAPALPRRRGRGRAAPDRLRRLELRRRRDRRRGAARRAAARCGAAARRGEAPRRDLARDDPLRARARARRRPQRDHGARGRARAGDAARRRAAADGDRARDRDGLQPAGPDVDLRHRARGLRADGRRAGAAAGPRPGARGRRAGRRPRRGPRGAARATSAGSSATRASAPRRRG